MIPEKILLEKGGSLRKYEKNQVIFFEGNPAGLYYQVMQGTIKVISINHSGKEFIHDIYKSGEGFGIPALLTEKPYPVTALANEDTTIISISRPEFMSILKEYPKLNFQFVKLLAGIIYNYSIIAKAISSHNPEYKILAILKIHKEKNHCYEEKNIKVDLSRQQIADMTGLRVETVIRTIKKMEKKSILKIRKGKIYF